MRFFRVSEDTCIVGIPKAGSLSMEEAINFNGGQFINVQESLIIPNRILFLRDWWERLNSAFTFFWLLEKNGTMQTEYLPQYILGTAIHKSPKPTQQAWMDFIDHVLDAPKEFNHDHWLPQTELATHEGIFLPTIVHKFEDIDAVDPEHPDFNNDEIPLESKSRYWSRYSPGRLPEKNRNSNHLPITQYRQDDLVARFINDSTMHSKINGSYTGGL